ncbi:two-component system response regulator [Methyloceanibacter methanicus]|uniref:Two-component system response regulator n=1 Tax=Methyloceanibacter methanicus TaxID=1774968 RepID=A0A1E3W327_9HYPH|nr:response regulator transcription factor [Methyloceanibacter methanicus]ODS00191.1 two-component system response regulator [Methyloceanibacter methanicus]
MPTRIKPQHGAGPDDNAPHILIVDDDSRIRDLLGRYLHDHGFRVSMAVDAESARAQMRSLAFDLIVLDVMMPKESGIDFAKSLRSHNQVPILMLTARAEPEQRIEGLETGVDDYLAKPFDPRELLLRVSNILKRGAQVAPSGEIRMGNFIFHISRGELQRDGETVRLTERERELLRYFAQRPGMPVSRHELAKGPDKGSDKDNEFGGERAVDVQINRLRRKIENDPANPVYLQTVRGKGYILYSE